MAMVNVFYWLPTGGQVYGSGRLAWSKGRRLLALFLHSCEPDELLTSKILLLLLFYFLLLFTIIYNLLWLLTIIAYY